MLLDHVRTDSVRLVPPPWRDGVYLLLIRGRVVYVGMSEGRFFERLFNHQKDKDFDEILFVDCHEAPLSQVSIRQIEAFLIQEFKPMYNQVYPFVESPTNEALKKWWPNA